MSFEILRILEECWHISQNMLCFYHCNGVMPCRLSGLLGKFTQLDSLFWYGETVHARLKTTTGLRCCLKCWGCCLVRSRKLCCKSYISKIFRVSWIFEKSIRNTNHLSLKIHINESHRKSHETHHWSTFSIFLQQHAARVELCACVWKWWMENGWIGV